MTQDLLLTKYEINSALDQLARLTPEKEATDAEHTEALAAFNTQYADLIERKKAIHAAIDALTVRIKDSIVPYQIANNGELPDDRVSVNQSNVYTYPGKDDDSPEGIAARHAFTLKVAQFAPILMTVNDEMLKDMAKGGLGSRSVFVNHLLVVLPELTFTKAPTPIIRQKMLKGAE